MSTLERWTANANADKVSNIYAAHINAQNAQAHAHSKTLTHARARSHAHTNASTYTHADALTHAEAHTHAHAR